MQARNTLPAPTLGAITAYAMLLLDGWRELRSPAGHSGSKAELSASAADQVIRERALARLAVLPGWDAQASNVYVEDGVVTLQGLIHSLPQRRAARGAVEGLQGVRAVCDKRVQPREG